MKECNHFIAIGYETFIGGDSYLILENDKSCLNNGDLDVEYFNYCPICGKKLEVKDEN